MEKVLFIGNFLSSRNGTLGVSETITQSELKQSFSFRLCSKIPNRAFRLFDMIKCTLLYNGEVIHIDVFSGLAFQFPAIVSLIAKTRRKKVIMTLHGGALPEYTRANQNKVKRVLRRADHIQSPSKYLIDYFDSIGVKVNYLPNPIDFNKFPYDRTDVKPYSILWVRAFTSIYNPDIPIRVLTSLLVDFPKTTLTMVGPDKGLQKEIQELALQLGVADRVNFVGPVPNDELYKYYQSHQVFLNTTSYESFGVAVVEAAACGIPIVSNPVGEIPHIWEHGINILFAHDNKVQNFVYCVRRIFTDEKLVLKLSKQGRLNSDQFDWKLIMPQWFSLLKDNDMSNE